MTPSIHLFRRTYWLPCGTAALCAVLAPTARAELPAPTLEVNEIFVTAQFASCGIAYGFFNFSNFDRFWIIIPQVARDQGAPDHWCPRPPRHRPYEGN